MFELDEKVVYPGYGVATVSKLVERIISGKKTYLYELKFFNKEMAVLIPQDKVDDVGIRKLSSKHDLNEMFRMLSSLDKKDSKHEIRVNNWNKRNKKYQLGVRSGDLFTISEIYKDLQLISLDKELSFGEKGLKSKIELLLVEEISVVQSINKEKALETLQRPFTKQTTKHHRDMHLKP